MFKDQITEKELVGTKIALLREKAAGKKEHWPIHKLIFDKKGNLECLETVHDSTPSSKWPGNEKIRNLKELRAWANDNFAEWFNYDCDDDIKCWSNQVNVVKRF